MASTPCWESTHDNGESKHGWSACVSNHSCESLMFIRNNKKTSTPGASPTSNTSFISLKIQRQMERIITIIKDMVILLPENESGRYTRMLWRSMDGLMELESSLLQLQVPTPPSRFFPCPGCGKPWPHSNDFDHTPYRR